MEGNDPLEGSPELVFRSGAERDRIGRFVEANLGAGRLLPDIARMILHPLTGLPCTARQIALAFPEQVNGDSALANMKVTASLYEQALDGDKGSDRVKASVKWLEVSEPEKWRHTTRVAVDGRIDVEVQHKVSDAMAKAREVLDALATRKRAVIEHDPAEIVTVEAEEAEIVEVNGKE